MFAHAGDSDDEDEDRENLVSKKILGKDFLKVFLPGGRVGGGEGGGEREAGAEEEELSASGGEGWP